MQNSQCVMLRCDRHCTGWAKKYSATIVAVGIKTKLVYHLRARDHITDALVADSRTDTV